MRFSAWLPGVASLALIACSSSSNPVAPDDSGAPDSSVGLDAPGDSPDETPPNDGGFPQVLSQQSIYSDFSTKTISPNLVYFEPAYVLWVDAELDGTTNVVALDKRRWIELPAGTQIDSTDMDHWIFPIGTKFWKEFSHDGQLLETRLIERIGPNLDDWRFGAYVWKADQSDATWTQAGSPNVGGTDHDVPNLQQCQSCHNGTISRINSFQAIQLSKPTGVNLTWLVQNNWLTKNPPPGVTFPVPGNAVESAALGYLHANCGHCHNEQNDTIFSITNQVLRLHVGDTDVTSTTTFRTTVNQKLTSFKQTPDGTNFYYRIWSGSSDKSAIPTRMSHRTDAAQMPPIATKHSDPNGVAAVKTWIDSLPKVDPPDFDAGTDAPPPPPDGGPPDDSGD